MTDLPIMMRKLLGIMVIRSYKDRMWDCIIPIHEIEITTGMEAQDLIYHVNILARKGISSEIYMEDAIPLCSLMGDFDTGWSYWNDIRDFCKVSGTSIDTICVDLNFAVFDE